MLKISPLLLNVFGTIGRSRVTSHNAFVPVKAFMWSRVLPDDPLIACHWRPFIAVGIRGASLEGVTPLR